MTWGVESDLVETIRNTDHMVSLAFEHVLERGYAISDDIIVITAGTPYGIAGRTNMLKVEQIPAQAADTEAADD
jgi:pyruvate kinase